MREYNKILNALLRSGYIITDISYKDNVPLIELLDDSLNTWTMVYDTSIRIWKEPLNIFEYENANEFMEDFLNIETKKNIGRFFSNWNFSAN